MLPRKHDAFAGNRTHAGAGGWQATLAELAADASLKVFALPLGIVLRRSPRFLLLPASLDFLSAAIGLRHRATQFGVRGSATFRKCYSGVVAHSVTPSCHSVL